MKLEEPEFVSENPIVLVPANYTHSKDKTPPRDLLDHTIFFHIVCKFPDQVAQESGQRSMQTSLIAPCWPVVNVFSQENKQRRISFDLKTKEIVLPARATLNDVALAAGLAEHANFRGIRTKDACGHDIMEQLFKGVRLYNDVRCDFFHIRWSPHKFQKFYLFDHKRLPYLPPVNSENTRHDYFINRLKASRAEHVVIAALSVAGDRKEGVIGKAIVLNRFLFG